MIILIPFMLLKLKDSIKKERTPENMEALRTLILDDIINLIQNNQDAGNITISDANRLRSLIRKLYNHLYSHYDEFIEGGFNDMMEDGLVLDVDIIEAELTKKVTKRVTKEVTEQVTQQITQQVTEQVTQQVTQQNLMPRRNPMLNISSILNNDVFTPEEQLEIIKYIDAQLEQMEILLGRLALIAAQASKDDTLNAERERLQEKVKQIQEGIDQISERLPQTFIMDNTI